MNARALGLLALHFWKHVFRKLTFTYARGGSARFVENYRDDRLLGVDPEERAALPTWQACIACGLCDALCAASGSVPATRDVSVTLTLASGPRDFSQLPLVGSDLALLASEGRCDDCGACEDACPVGVPIRDVVRFLEKHGDAARPALLPDGSVTSL